MNPKQMGKTSLKYTKFQPRGKRWGQNAFGVFIKEGLSRLTDGSRSSGRLGASVEELGGLWGHSFQEHGAALGFLKHSF